MATYTGSDKRLQYLFQNGGGGGGTTVIANPAGTATDTLNKLQVGSIIYNVPSGGSGSHIYSTSEHVVGQWIDGKPVYEITYYIQNPVSGGNYPIISNIKEVIDIHGTWQRKGTGYDWFYQLNATNEGSAMGTQYEVIARPRLNNDSLYVYVGSAYSSDCKLIILTMQYTKTTD